MRITITITDKACTVSAYNHGEYSIENVSISGHIHPAIFRMSQAAICARVRVFLTRCGIWKL